ncbi:MAG TPA: NAD-dependent epimerase/dehydratase family protein [Ktedonobacteraceae bacterium]
MINEQSQQMVEKGATVFLTGASGFVGSHVLHALVAARYQVHALVRPGSRPLPALEGCTPVWGDVLHAGELVQSMRGCRYLIHVAALYSFAPAMRQHIFETNVRGCAGILEAAHLAGIERAVVTSSSSTVGPSREGQPATEENWDVEDGSSGYHPSKLQQARIALAARIPTVLVLPTAPVGPGDWKPTPTGKLLVDFMRGRIFATLDGGLNIVAVEDVARAHILALQHGYPGERYLVGGEDISFPQLWQRLAHMCGRSTPTLHIPYRLALTLGWADELRCQLWRRSRSSPTPLIPLEGVHMARHHMYASSAKAETELGYQATSTTAALERAIQWYRDNKYATR